MERGTRSYWDGIAPGLRVASPLGPGPDDLAWLGQRCAELRSPGGLRGLVLGITPDILALAWPAGAFITVVDWSRAMLRHRWPATAAAGVGVVVGDWRELPLDGGSLDFACGDGSFTSLGNNANVPLVAAEVARALKPRAPLWLRCFVVPERPPSPADLKADLLAARIRSAALFRGLLLVALHARSPEGVVLDDAWAAWRKLFPDAGELRRACGWSDDDVLGFERWRGKSMRYCFHSLRQLEEMTRRCFEIERVDPPLHQYGECFPRITFRKG